MQYAYHPTADRFIDVEAYTREFGRQPTGHQGEWKQEKARCPYCPAHLTPRAESKSRIAHFVHPRNSHCPSISRISRPYHGLTPEAGDAQQAAALFDAFLAEWQAHYSAVRSLVPLLNADEFEEIVSAATAANSWAWVDMPLWAVPYMLLLQRDYPPQAPNERFPGLALRELWFRFWFHHEPRPLNALWIDAPPGLQLVRASYYLGPRQRRPTEAELTREPRRFDVGPALLEDGRAAAQPSQRFVNWLGPRLQRVRARLRG